MAGGARGRIGTLQRIAREIRCDVAAARERDPAARGVSSLEILLNWPGVHALLAHRVSSALHGARVPLVPRAMALATRAITNIEIHPAARIGQGLFIDHGPGVVGGETAEIGDNVTLYQGVTLGGTGFATGKRHPTVQDNVTIGSGAKLLGPIPVGHAIRALSRRLDALERAVAEMPDREAGEAGDPPGEVRPLRPRRGPNPARGQILAGAGRMMAPCTSKAS